MTRSTVPFKISDSYEGFAESIGLLAVTRDEIRLDFETQDALFGMFRSGVKSVTIPLDAIDEIGFTKSIWGNKIELRLNRLDLIRSIPGQKHAEIKLSIARKHADLASDAIRSIQLRIAENEYDEALSA
ncbi:hypothetical protein [Kordiimonas sp. SCSIO 12610]|uniref:hypothetical protein n=1 Tax=Kordiimonas sp. SCSIO 12610 TaxID=2829597 RepID=UPI002108A3CF|nr:hypothetical protein [Kordiimonas sp. SCSIO 12610]UTW55559.1 hypothetical protein KFF44_01300 [Kordiimonas sp. SCSIO 12610]